MEPFLRAISVAGEAGTSSRRGGNLRRRESRWRGGGGGEDSPRKWQRWEGEKSHGGLKMQWGPELCSFQNRGDLLCTDKRKSSRG